MGRVPARLALVGVVALVAGACKTGPGEDRPSVEVIGGGGSVSVSGAVEGYGEALYFSSTDQAQNLAIGLDLRDLRELMSGAAGAGAVDWPAVLALYQDGRNQAAPNGVRSLASLASAAYPDAFPDAAAVYGRQAFIDGFLRDAIAGTGRATGLGDNARRLIVDRGVQVVQYGLALTSLHAAETHMAAGSTAEAAAAVDAGWAALAGARATTMPNNGILATGLAREEEFVLAGRLARPLEAHLFQALAAVQQRNPDGVREALGTSRGYLNTIFYLSILRDSKVLAGDARAADREVHLAEGWTFLQALRAQIAAVSGPAAQRLEAAFTRDPADTYPAAETEAVYAAMNEERVLEALQIPADFRFTSPAQ
jgi:hypothetical protein